MNMKQFIQGLNSDLANEMSAVAAYVAYAGSIAGLHRMELHDEFVQEAHEEMEHAALFARRIAALGGVPEPHAEPPPPTRNLTEMIRILLSMEKQALIDYAERAEQARQLGHPAIAVEIEDILADEQEHHDMLLMMLQS